MANRQTVKILLFLGLFFKIYIFKKTDSCREKSKLNRKFNWKNKNIAKITREIMDFLNEFYFQSEQHENVKGCVAWAINWK